MKSALFCFITFCSFAAQADVILTEPAPESFLRNAMMYPVGKYTTEWDKKTRPDAKKYSSMKAYQIASIQARFANIPSLKQAVEQDCVAKFGAKHQKSCHCAVQKADFKEYAEQEIQNIRLNKASGLIFRSQEEVQNSAMASLHPIWFAYREIERECGLQEQQHSIFH
ncbi:hypothetical protein ACKLNO_11600 [Neisseriaceae bacterium B1]